MSAMSKIIGTVAAVCLLSWPAGADDTKVIRFLYHTGCAPIVYEVKLQESPTGSTFINREQLADMVELSLRREGMLSHDKKAPYVLLLRILSYTDVVEFTLRFMKPMKDLSSDVTFLATTYLRSFAITSPGGVDPTWDLLVETRVRMVLNTFIEGYMLANGAEC